MVSRADDLPPRLVDELCAAARARQFHSQRLTVVVKRAIVQLEQQNDPLHVDRAPLEKVGEVIGANGSVSCCGHPHHSRMREAIQFASKPACETDKVIHSSILPRFGGQGAKQKSVLLE